MEHVYSKIEPDFASAERTTLNLRDWMPIEVEYIYMDVNYLNTLCWRVVGTTHVFKIDMPTLYKHHGKDYIPDHFVRTLTAFRDDYISWTINRDPRAERYHDDFGHLILL